MANGELKNVGRPDEVRKFENGQIEVVNIGGGTVGRARFEPGWKWSQHVKPIAGTELCEAPHFLYQLAGRMKVVLKDGTEMESGPGDVAVIPPGHDAWVVGEEPVEVIDWGGAANYAKG
jgi:quercetin dioxygenase-like cupin family protein